MATVAGAIAEFVGRDIVDLSDVFIIENGGDIYLKDRCGKGDSDIRERFTFQRKNRHKAEAQVIPLMASARLPPRSGLP